jgi:DNA replication protein DnaC
MLTPIKQSRSQFSDKPVFRVKFPLENLDFALGYWKEFAKSAIDKEFEFTSKNLPKIKELIKYSVGDEDFKGYLEKGIFIYGPTGSGKTLMMNILSQIIDLDKVFYYRYGQPRTFQFKTVTARELCSSYGSKGFEAIDWYAGYNILFIDDVGTEQERTKFYGTELDVVGYLVEERSRQKRITHYTSNLTPDDLNARYGSRVESRIKGECNLLLLNDKDFRVY